MSLNLTELYPASVNSVATVTIGALNEDTTTFEVLDSSVLPDVPNLLVIGQDQTAETVLMTAKDGNTLTVTRGIQGTAKAWQSGVQIARNFTAKDWNDIISNFAVATNYLENLTASDIGAVPTDRTINDKALTSDVSLSASDVGAVKAYGSLSELGLEEATATAQTIVEAMANNSILLHGLSGTATSATLAFPYSYSLLKVTKLSNGYTRFECIGTGAALIYYGYYNGGTTTKWSGWSTKFLPLDGSVAMSGNILKLGNDIARWIASNSTTALYIMETEGDSNNRRQLSIHGSTEQADISKALAFYDVKNGSAVGGSYKIYGEHNKPSGSYTGNGSATTNPLSLDVQNVGIGKVMFITSNNGSAFVTPNGAILFNGAAVTVVSSSQANYTPLVITKNSDGTETRSGGLALATTNTILNANGVRYNYFAL